jgi:hypothetical protein
MGGGRREGGRERGGGQKEGGGWSNSEGRGRVEQISTGASACWRRLGRAGTDSHWGRGGGGMTSRGANPIFSPFLTFSDFFV